MCQNHSNILDFQRSPCLETRLLIKIPKLKCKLSFETIFSDVYKTEVLWTWGVDIDHTASNGSFPVRKSRLQINVHILRPSMSFETIGAWHSSATPGYPPKTSICTCSGMPSR